MVIEVFELRTGARQYTIRDANLGFHSLVINAELTPGTLWEQQEGKIIAMAAVLTGVSGPEAYDMIEIIHHGATSTPDAATARFAGV